MSSRRLLKLFIIYEAVLRTPEFSKCCVRKLGPNSVYSCSIRRFAGYHGKVFLLREEIALFLEMGRTAKEQEFHLKMTDHTVILKLAYLAYYFGELNQLNLSLQGNVVNILSAQEKVTSPAQALALPTKSSGR